MWITRLRLENFKNHSFFDIFPKRGINFFIGGNGKGKTALLEASYLAFLGKPFRHGKNWIKKQEQAGSILLNFQINEGQGQIKVSFFKEGQTQFFFNEKKNKTCPFKNICVFFFPEHLSALRGDASQRRKLIDELVWQQDVEVLKNFQKILAQKNQALKWYAKNKNQEDYLSSINEIFFKNALNLIQFRLKALKSFKPFWIKRGLEFLQSQHFDVQYIGSGEVIDHFGEAEISLKKEMKTQEALEKIRGFALAGPHRHDLLFTYQDFEARQSLSQGQQRALLLSWKLAQWDQMHEKNKEAPCFFLDDVFSEIDQHFRKNLIKFLLNNQVQSFITATELNEALYPHNTTLFHLGDRFGRSYEATL